MTEAREHHFGLKNARGQELACVLHGELGPRVVVGCHGMLSSKDSRKLVRLSRSLPPAGLPLLRFDFAGRGESQGSLYDLSISHEVEDLASVLDWLGTQGVQRVGLYGSSLGGAVALLAAARDERVIAIATIAALAHPELMGERNPDYEKAWLEQGALETHDGPIGRGFYDDALQHDVLSAVAILRCPLLVIHGTADTVVPCSDSHDIAATAREARLELIEGGDHELNQETVLRPLVREVTSFFAERV